MSRSIMPGMAVSTDGDPATLPCLRLGLVEHDSLPDAADPRIESRAARRSGPGVKGVTKREDLGVATGQ